MADMIEAKDAKKMLGCDDAALTNLVNSGQIKAQRVGGKLMLLKSDVEKVAAASADGDDGTIVLTGDSDDLSIDLGKVVDDSAETIVTSKKATDTGAGTESITFGEDLEVVSFDDNSNTGEIAFDQNKKGSNLSFTDSNTAVMTAVDETAVGGTTQPVEFQTEANDAARPGSNRSPSSRMGSARSQRASVEDQKVHWFWTTCLVLTMLVTVFLVVPYYVIAMFPFGNGSDKLANKDRRLGVDDSGWTSMAGSLAGFTVEPNKERYVSVYKGAPADYMGIKESGRDPQATWRYEAYRGEKNKGNAQYKIGDRLNDYTFASEPDKPSPVAADGSTVTSKSGVVIPVRERPVGSADRPIMEKFPDLSGAK